MSRTPSKSIPHDKKNGKKHTIPAYLVPAVAQAVLEDAVMEAAADMVARAATAQEDSEYVPVIIAPETPEEQEIIELLNVPYLGPTRVRALAAAGIKTLADLLAATPAEIGGVKGVGFRNAERIKEWLAAQKVSFPGMPPQPPPPAMAAASPDLPTAAINQAIQDAWEQIEEAGSRIRTVLSAKVDRTRFDRQMDKLSSVLSELAEGPDTMRPKQMRQALKMLNRIAAPLSKVAGLEKITGKALNNLADELRDCRKRLEKIVGE